MIQRTSIAVLVLATFFTTSLFAMPTFQELCNGLADKAGDKGVVVGVDGWLFLKEELRHLGAGRFWSASQTTKKSFTGPIQTIAEYNRLLAERGILLYLMPVPPKGLVYPDKLAKGVDPGAAAKEVAHYDEFYQLLNGAGVRSINLLPILLANRNKKNVYCKTDSHFSGEGLALFAKAAAGVIKKEEWYSSMGKKDYRRLTRQMTIKGDLSQMLGGTEPQEGLELTVVSEKNGDKALVSDPQSPVILLGDSHVLVFNAGGDLHARGAGLFDHLSAQLGIPVDLLGVRGSGVTPARIKLFQRSKRDGGYLEGKKVLIWCFSARYFTASGDWRHIPVAP